MVGKVLQQLLADPRLAQSHRIGDQHAVVTGQDAAGLLDGIVLEFGQFNRARPSPAASSCNSSRKYSYRALM